MINSEPNPIRDRLCRYGMSLFLLGLLIGFMGPAFKNPRLILSAHLEGLMNGMFLILVGLLLNHMQFSPKRMSFATWLLIAGGYANWLACILGAAFGASRMTPIAGAGLTASPWQETLVMGMFGFVGVDMTIAVSILVWELKPRKKENAGQLNAL